jgi:hypothetical protein
MPISALSLKFPFRIFFAVSMFNDGRSLSDPQGNESAQQRWNSAAQALKEKVTAHKTLRTRRQKYNYIQKQCREVSQLIKMPE